MPSSRRILRVNLVTLFLNVYLVAALLLGLSIPLADVIHQNTATITLAASLPLILTFLAKSIEGWSIITLPAFASSILLLLSVITGGIVGNILAVFTILTVSVHALAIYLFPIRNIIKAKGKFQVGYKHQKDEKHDFCVFYPTLKVTSKEPIWADRISSQTKFHELVQTPEKTLPQWLIHTMFDFKSKITIPVGIDSPILDNNALKQHTECKKLIPVIFSHGLGGHLHNYSSLVSQLASQGYFIIAIDHADSVFEIKKDLTDLSAARVYLEKRVKQVRDLITQIESTPDYLNKMFGTNVELDFDRLVIMGHSYGGLTAYQVACEDKRIKSCVALDPWLAPLNKGNLSARLNCDLLLVESEDWNTSYPLGEISERNAKVMEAQRKNGNIALYCHMPTTQHNHFSDDFLMIGGISKLVAMIKDLKVCGENYVLIAKIFDDYLSTTVARNREQGKENIKNFLSIYEGNKKFPAKQF